MTILAIQFENFKLNFLTLSFSEGLEGEFVSNYFKSSLRHVRIALLLAIFFYSIFGLLDAWLVPEAKKNLWFIRYAIFVPFVFAVFLFSFHRTFQKYMQLSIATVILVAGLGIIAMILLAPYPGNYSYYAGLILVFIYGYTFFKLRFIWATAAGWLIVIAYEFAAVVLSQTPIPVLLNNNFFFLSGNIIGMFACYSIEYFSRKDFIQARLLELEKKKVDIANRELEKRVADRTRQLAKSNEELKEEIYEREKSEKALGESEKRYRTILESIDEGYFEVDLSGNFTFFNGSLSKITGFPANELLGMNNRDYTSPKTAKKMFKIFNKVYRTGQPAVATDYEIIRKNGEPAILELSANLIKDHSGNAIGFRGIVRDFTERLKAEKEKKKLEVKLQNARSATILGLAKLAEYRDEGTGSHLERIPEYTKIITKELAKKPKYRRYITKKYIEDIYNSSILHDIGKVGIPDNILLKPGKLSAKEFEHIKSHTLLGGDTLTAIDAQTDGKSFLTLGKEIAYYHHEKWDGTGYPNGLKGEEIPLSARIVALADVYDAFTSERLYKKAFSHNKAKEMIIALKAKYFDPDVVDAFLAHEVTFNKIRTERITEEIALPASESLFENRSEAIGNGLLACLGFWNHQKRRLIAKYQ
ncbi:MAG: PAS domain S-box protein [Desulfobacterales bacterium]